MTIINYVACVFEKQMSIPKNKLFFVQFKSWASACIRLEKKAPYLDMLDLIENQNCIFAAQYDTVVFLRHLMRQQYKVESSELSFPEIAVILYSSRLLYSIVNDRLSEDQIYWQPDAWLCYIAELHMSEMS